ncbi:rho GTPase-activating protein 21 isoform X2 [Octopus bimaculoides]|uniref:rho GTPase-activating protein 21 isoform X2 n=1 Tax=Octopus bimaculoides TaxID=37653 RepID=UPI00071C58D7|nr:rho GTPase-activating protein 21 isoform X2 [Octopus bimaculoides]|eukprot:XP_014782142.1 PREDICTED: rho GTPase-activating protein 21-like isoform X2 [Octopus bimaculoides]
MLKIILSTDKPSRKIQLLRNWGREKLPFRRSGMTTTVIEQCTTIGTLCTTTISTIYTTVSDTTEHSSVFEETSPHFIGQVDGDNPISSSNSATTTSSVLTSWSGPHTVIVPRTEAGFGFTLRHFIVYPPESSTISQTQDGASIADENDPEVRRHKRTKLSDLEPMDTIFVKHVKEDSPAELAGLNTGDRIVSVNGEPVTGKTYSQVISLIQSSDSSLKLLVVPKNEDILQMAYKNTAYNQTSADTFISSHSSSTPVISVKPAVHSQSALKETTVYLPDRVKERKVSFTFGENQHSDPIFSTTTIKEINPSPLVTSTSFSSGISLQREPLVPDNMNKAAFLDRKREFEQRAAQTSEQKIDSYSFGLYFPPKKDQQKSNSIDNIYVSSSGSNSRRRTSRENVLQSRESFENVSRSESYFQSPLYNAKDSRQTFSTTLRTISSENKMLPRSQTTSSLSSFANTFSPGLSAKTDFLTNNHSSTVEASKATTSHCTPIHSAVASVVHPPLQISPLNQPNSRSIYQSPNSSNGVFNRSLTSREEPSPQSRHVIYKTMCGTPVLNKTSLNAPSTAPVLPVSYNQRPVLIQRKSQMEFTPSAVGSSSSNNITTTTSTLNNQNSAGITPVRTICVVSSKRDTQSPSSVPLSPSNRYKTEIEKITSRTKFESVATRAAQFEIKPNEVSLPSPVIPLNYKQHRTSERLLPQDNYKTYTCTPVQSPAERTTTYKAALTKSLSTPVSPNQDTTPVQMEKKLLDTYSRYDSTPSMNNCSSECYVTDGPCITRSEGKDFKPTTKASYITSINATVNNSDSTLLNMSSCAENKESFFSHSTFESDQVTLRKKTEDLSPEQDAVKLQRRTSYLMATAKERSDLNTPLQSINKFNSITPDKLSLPIYDSSSQTVQSKKLKSSILIEEKTNSSIAEEPSRSDFTPPQSSSPPKEAKKEGCLSCKNAIIDGKRSSDRSWKPCLVLLKGQELYLTDKRKDNNSVISEFDQPVSIKSSSVEVATDYTKKKNVFRLTTNNHASEFLFQAEDNDTMWSWIQALRSSSDSEIDYETTPTHIPNIKSSPQMPVKSSKKLQVLSFRHKMTHSPSTRRRKTNDGTKTKSWKEKIRFKNKGNNQPPAPEEATGSFGVHLELCTPSPYKESIPFVIDLCTSIVETRGLKVIGVYRIPGNKLVISNMQEEFNKGLEYINQENEKWQDVNVISSLLKSFFQKLPEPLVTNELYQSFINANQIENPQKRMLTLKRVIHQLPDVHFETFRHLAHHLRKIADHSHINKMCARNLAIVLGPTLVRRHDEDVQAMAIDMSHQCRIIESVILHPDWFFSSWDVDDHVPVDENGAAEVPTGTVSPMAPASTPDDDLDESEETNPLEIVAAMIAAAKNKNHNKKTKGLDEADSSTPPGPKYEERNIDAEIAKFHSNKALANSMELQSDGSQSQLDTISYNSRLTSEHKASVSSLSIGFDDYTDSEVFSKSSNPHLARQFSDESLLEKSDELEFSYGLQKTFSHSLESNLQSKQEFLKKVQEQHKRECEVREKESKKFDQEYLRTKHEMELEDKHSLEELLNPRKIWYSTNHPYSAAYAKPYDSLDSYQLQGKSWSTSKAIEPVSGGKYFVSVGNSKISDRTSYLNTGFDNAKRSNSLETIIDTGQVWSSPLSMVARKTQDRELSPQNDSDLGLTRRNSLRRGSLDSMIDFYDKKENRLSWASTDSEDGSDLLTSLTSTFDQKLQILLNPKYKLNGSSRPRPPSNIGVPPYSAVKNNEIVPSNSNVYDCTSESLELAQAESTRMLNLGLAYSRQAKKNTDVFDSFRDPSLHRSQKPETKIGIASRFTRSNSSPTAHVLGERAIITHGAAPIAASHLASSSELVQRRSNGGGLCTEYIDSKLSNLGKIYSLSPSASASPPKDCHSKKNLKSSCNKNNCFNGGYRSENTRKNFRDSASGQQLWTPRSTVLAKVNTTAKPRSNSPPPLARRKVRGKRRHTVGGSEHYNTLVLLLQRKDDPSRTIFKEAFQPTPKIKEVHDYSPLAWLQAYSLQTGSSDSSFPAQPTIEQTLRK